MKWHKLCRNTKLVPYPGPRWSVRAVIPSVVVSLTGCWQIIISFQWQKPIITVSLSPHALKRMMSWQQQFCIFRFLGAHYLMIWLNQKKKKKKRACSQELQTWSGNYAYCVTRLFFWKTEVKTASFSCSLCFVVATPYEFVDPILLLFMILISKHLCRMSLPTKWSSREPKLMHLRWL